MRWRTLGLERARNLAHHFFRAELREARSHPTFDWTPLWRHQIAVGVVMDFIYDALNLRRSGLEYVTGAFHDIGKMILAELFPFAYFTAMNRSMQDEISAGRMRAGDVQHRPRRDRRELAEEKRFARRA